MITGLLEKVPWPTKNLCLPGRQVAKSGHMAIREWVVHNSNEPYNRDRYFTGMPNPGAKAILSARPNICTTYDMRKEQGQALIAMESLDGFNLKHHS